MSKIVVLAETKSVLPSEETTVASPPVDSKESPISTPSPATSRKRGIFTFQFESVTTSLKLVKE